MTKDITKSVQEIEDSKPTEMEMQAELDCLKKVSEESKSRFKEMFPNVGSIEWEEILE